ncbi:MAG: CvpA family protein [Gammaproteobacteria bacterium]|nr:CvpA family protein [Gammaproteobacteria bacterium]MDH3535071.1 CvpA family protein [Gammaproteobacteria bacterium]
MDWSLVIVVCVVLYFAYRGYRNGLLKSVSRISSVLAGYLCAIFYTGQFTPVIESQLALQGIAAFIVASLALFVGASLAVVFIFWVIAKILADGAAVSTASSIGGAAVGSATGVLLAIVVVWGFAFARDTLSTASTDVAARSGPSDIERLANKAAGKAATAAMTLGSANPEVTRLGAALFESPAEITRLAQRLGRSEELSMLLNDPENLAVLNRGDHAAVQNLPAFRQLVNNPDTRALAAVTGLVDEADENNQSLDAALAIKLTDVWGRAQRVKNDARVQEILGDPEFQQEIQSANPLALLTNERLLELANIIFSEPPAPDGSANQPASGQLQDDAAQVAPSDKVKKLYRWTDDNGRVFYSDVEPGS